MTDSNIRISDLVEYTFKHIPKLQGEWTKAGLHEVIKQFWNASLVKFGLTESGEIGGLLLFSWLTHDRLQNEDLLFDHNNDNQVIFIFVAIASDKRFIPIGARQLIDKFKKAESVVFNAIKHGTRIVKIPILKFKEHFT